MTEKPMGVLYRPPSEGKNPILRLTVGCAHNDCTFCSMYQSVPFYVRNREDVLSDLLRLGAQMPWAKRLFFADGDALCLATDTLLYYIKEAKAVFPQLSRISCYATVQDILRKSPEDLSALHDAGLTLLYVGLESGDNQILRAVKKGITQEMYVTAAQKAHEAGMHLSVTLISGLYPFSDLMQAAKESARAVSASCPDYLSYLTLYLEPEAPLYADWARGDFSLPSADDSLREIYAFLQQVNAPGCVFRVNHASNYLSLKGTLNKDRKRLLTEIDKHLIHRHYRPEWMRRL